MTQRRRFLSLMDTRTTGSIGRTGSTLRHRNIESSKQALAPQGSLSAAMSGFQLLLNLIPLARKPTIAVIMLTRLDLPPVAQLAKNSGAYAYLVKSRATGDDP